MGGKKEKGKGKAKANPSKAESSSDDKGRSVVAGAEQSDAVFPLLSVLTVAVGNELGSHRVD